MKKTLLILVLLAILIILPLFTSQVFALQPPPPPDPEPIPIDGGLGFLIAAGLAYGARKLRLRTKKEEG